MLSQLLFDTFRNERAPCINTLSAEAAIALRVYKMNSR